MQIDKNSKEQQTGSTATAVISQMPWLGSPVTMNWQLSHQLEQQ
jgi:hypothetical protein